MDSLGVPQIGPVQVQLSERDTCGNYGSVLLPDEKVFTNGMLSNEFTISNGTRQGCPLSPLTFAMMMEPLTHLIKQSPDIEGIR